MVKPNNGGPAFPRPTQFMPDGRLYDPGSEGMSKLEFYAGLAMMGDFANAGRWNKQHEEGALSYFAMAQAMVDVGSKWPVVGHACGHAIGYHTEHGCRVLGCGCAGLEES